MKISSLIPIAALAIAALSSNPNAQQQEDITRRRTAFASYGQRPGCPNGYLVGACTSGRKAHCVESPAKFAFQSAICADISSQPDIMRVEAGHGIGRWSFDRWAKCPPGKIASYRCSSGKLRDCHVNGRYNAHAIWCRDPPQGMYLTQETEYKCGRYGEPVHCSPGYAVIQSCGSGRWADCTFGACSHIRSWTQLKCQRLYRSDVWSINPAPAPEPVQPPLGPMAPIILNEKDNGIYEAENEGYDKNIGYNEEKNGYSTVAAKPYKDPAVPCDRKRA